MALRTVKAKKVREGDFIPALDNAYVYRDAEREDGKGYNDTVVVMFHDSDGGEGEIICAANMTVTVERR